MDTIHGSAKATRTYVFNKDGTVKTKWVSPVSNTSYEGTYTIKSDQIIVEADGKTYSIIKYTYKDGVLTMFDTLGDGSGNYEMKKS